MWHGPIPAATGRLIAAHLETRKAQLDTFTKKGAFEAFASFDLGIGDAADPKDLSLERFIIEHAESFK